MTLILQNLISKLTKFSLSKPYTMKENANFNHDGLKIIPNEHLGYLKSL